MMTNEQGNFNTFWACKMHSNHASLRCAICDENKLIELQTKVEELEAEKTTLIKLGQEDSRYQNLLSETQSLRAKVEELEDEIRYRDGMKALENQIKQESE